MSLTTDLMANLGVTETGNALARIFHVELKDLVRKALEILSDRLPNPTVSDMPENFTARYFITLRDSYFTHARNSWRERHIRAAFNFIIMLCADGYYREHIAWICRQIQAAPLDSFKETGPDERWWKE